MAIRDILKISRKTFVNPTGWLDYESLKDQNRTIWGSIRNLFKTPEPRRNETFEAAIKRLNLTDEDVTQAIKTYHSYALLFFCIAFILFCYAFYLLFTYWTIPGWLLAMATCAFSLSQSFKYHFWALQMKQRRLGISFKEWLNHVLGKDRAS